MGEFLRPFVLKKVDVVDGFEAKLLVHLAALVVFTSSLFLPIIFISLVLSLPVQQPLGQLEPLLLIFLTFFSLFLPPQQQLYRLPLASPSFSLVSLLPIKQEQELLLAHKLAIFVKQLQLYQHPLSLPNKFSEEKCLCFHIPIQRQF